MRDVSPIYRLPGRAKRAYFKHHIVARTVSRGLKLAGWYVSVQRITGGFVVTWRNF